jgi:hypothetical protein
MCFELLVGKTASRFCYGYTEPDILCVLVRNVGYNVVWNNGYCFMIYFMFNL